MNNLIINKFQLTYIFIFFTFVGVYEINFTKTIILVLNFMLFIVMINSKQMNNKGRKIIGKIYKIIFYCMASLKLEYENQYDLIS